VEWYNTNHIQDTQNPEHEMLATDHNRKPDHLKRVAINLHFAEHKTLQLCSDCFDRALNLLNWTEQFLPDLLQQMFKSSIGEMNEQVLRIINAFSPIPHSDLVRKVSGKMSAQELRNVVQSLKEANLVVERIDNVGHYYEVVR
jgi:hypothetical protein